MSAHQTPPSPLAITGVGLVTSVGSSALATVAALRAGVARVREVPGVQILDRSGTRAEPLVAARSPLHGTGVAPGALGAALLADAIADAAAWVPPDRWETDVSPWLQTEAPRGVGALEHIGLVGRLVELAETSAPAPVGLAAADSLTTAAALRHYADTGRVKGSAAPSGFVPGEAAAAVVAESVTSARAGGRAVLAVVESWSRGHEPVPLGGATPSPGTGLTEALAGALGADAPFDPAADLLVADLNGERPRALEWGLAAARVLPHAEGALRTWTPADGVGECGRSTGLLLIACAALALARGGAERALVSLSDDDGGRCAVVLRAVDRVGPPGGTRRAGPGRR